MATQSSAAYFNNTLELDNLPCGPLRKIEGGNAFADVVPDAPDPSGIVRKNLGSVKYEDLVLVMGAEMWAGVYAWISDMFARQDQPKNGAIVLPDSAQSASRVEFTNAFISEVTFPALDDQSKDPLSLTLKLSPEYTRSAKGSVAPAGPKPNAWSAQNFQLQIDGLDGRTVSRIEALTVKRTLARKPTILDIGNLAFVVDETGADALIAWHENMVIKGNSEQKKNGTLRYVSGNSQDALFTLTFGNLGIFKLSREIADAGPGAGPPGPRRLRAELFCEEIGLQYTAVAAPNPLNVNVNPYTPPPLTLSVAPTVSPYTPPVLQLSITPSPTGRFSQPPTPQQAASQLNLPRPPGFILRT
jgi:hypothetical protein